MTQCVDGRRGTFWHGSPNGSVAAQWACTEPPCAETVFLVGAFVRALPEAFALPVRPLAAGFRPTLPAFLGAAALRVFLAGRPGLAAFLRLAGLMGDRRVHPRPALKSDHLRRRVPGLWYEQFEPGAVIEHPVRLKVTQEDNAAFCRLTLNRQPLHLDEGAARQAGFRTVLVNGLYTFSAAVGASVEDTTAGTLVANLGYQDVEHPKPVHPGDTLSFRTEVLEKRPSSKPGRGLVTLQHRALNQDGAEVCRFKRTVMVLTQPAVTT